MRTILDLVCAPPFTCRATLLSSRVAVDELCLDGATLADDDRLAMQLVEPLELLALARELAGRDGFELRAFAGTEGAMALLRDDCEPTRSTWQWAQDSLALELPADVTAFVAGRDAGYLDLSADLDDPLARPILVLEESSGRQVIDTDRFGDSLVFERDQRDWYVSYHPPESRFQGRTRPHRRGQRTMGPPLLNGSSLHEPHRLTTGDRLEYSWLDRSYGAREVIAII